MLQQLQASQPNPNFYWATEKGTAGVDFVLQCGQDVILIEVKAEENLRAKSLKSYVEQYQPSLAIRASMLDYRVEDWVVNVPLYGLCTNNDLIHKENVLTANRIEVEKVDEVKMVQKSPKTTL